MARYRLIFSGTGGQGVILAAVILGEAAVIQEGMNAVQSQSYGPEARGGASRSELIISDSKINFPKVNNANMIACLGQEAYDKYYHTLRPGGLLITDSNKVRINKNIDARHVEIPLYQTAVEKVGNPLVLNICLVGAVVRLTKIVKLESVAKTLENHINRDYIEINRKALQLGYELAADINGS